MEVLEHPIAENVIQISIPLFCGRKLQNIINIHDLNYSAT